MDNKEYKEILEFAKKLSKKLINTDWCSGCCVRKEEDVSEFYIEVGVIPGFEIPNIDEYVNTKFKIKCVERNIPRAL